MRCTQAPIVLLCPLSLCCVSVLLFLFCIYVHYFSLMIYLSVLPILALSPLQLVAGVGSTAHQSAAGPASGCSCSRRSAQASGTDHQNVQCESNLGVIATTASNKPIRATVVPYPAPTPALGPTAGPPPYPAGSIAPPPYPGPPSLPLGFVDTS